MTPEIDCSNEMRQRAEWMMPVDDELLEMLKDHGHLTPAAMAHYGSHSKGHYQNRTTELQEYGLIEKPVDGLYKLTNQGHAYLDEELDASELEPVDEVE